MLRIGMRTLNGKARQTAVAAFAHMPEPPPSKIERRAWRRVSVRPARDFADVSEAERIPLQEMILHSTKQRISS